MPPKISFTDVIYPYGWLKILLSKEQRGKVLWKNKIMKWHGMIDSMEEVKGINFPALFVQLSKPLLQPGAEIVNL